DSLALLDRTIGEIRRSMEKAGTWDTTTVLFTSDHPYREAMQLNGKSDPRIPYILKLASQKEGVEYAPQFNTVLTGDLLIAVLRGEVADAPSAAAWLDRNRERSLWANSSNKQSPPNGRGSDSFADASRLISE